MATTYDIYPTEHGTFLQTVDDDARRVEQISPATAVHVMLDADGKTANVWIKNGPDTIWTANLPNYDRALRLYRQITEQFGWVPREGGKGPGSQILDGRGNPVTTPSSLEEATPITPDAIGAIPAGPEIRSPRDTQSTTAAADIKQRTMP